MIIVENNYKPKVYTIEHNGYRVICKSCNSILIIDKNELECDRYGFREFTCPCCGITHSLTECTHTKEKWVTKISK